MLQPNPDLQLPVAVPNDANVTAAMFPEAQASSTVSFCLARTQASGGAGGAGGSGGGESPLETNVSDLPEAKPDCQPKSERCGVPSFPELEAHGVGASKKVFGDIVHVEDGRSVPHGP